MDGSHIERSKRRENPKRAEKVYLVTLAIAIVTAILIHVASQAIGKTAHTVLAADARATAFQEGW
ncbi:hypothetical protein [Shimia sp. MIT910701]|uniref:hypothetical protein n=1 Tax=Shimia sp. MIT910701 TaxID=3096987 RepID=UPI003999EFE0